MKDRFNTDVRAEGQVHSGSAARRRRKYRYHRELAFLRPVLATRATWSSTLQPVPGAVLHRSTSDPSQPSDSQETACRSATWTAGDQEAGQAGVPLSQVSATGYAGTTRQRQRALERNVLPEFMHLSEAFHASLKSLSDRVEGDFSLMERGFNHMENRFHSVDQHFERLEADLNRPAHHFFSKIEKGMAVHLSPEQQLSVLQACNTAYLQAMQQNRYVQQSVVSFPTAPLLTRYTSLPTSPAYYCTATCIPSKAGHHYTTPSPSAAGHSFATTTIGSAASVWSTATAPPAWSTATTEPAWATDTYSYVQSTATISPSRSTTTQHQRSPATTPPQRSPATTPPQRSPATTPPQRSPATTPPQRSPATTPPQRSPATTPPQRSPATTPPQRSPATTPPQRSPATTLSPRITATSLSTNTSLSPRITSTAATSRSTDTTLSPSRSTATATIEHQRGDPHSLFFRSTPWSTSSRRSSKVRRSHGGSRSSQDTPAPKKKKQDFVCPSTLSS
ncbi:uncharacterized protein [Dendrobates tinctorius]|uniref:uncharacterized protein n=1 Tax=Dendrobates tinctorius TaxID=92724 RepID=UPI003CCA6574